MTPEEMGLVFNQLISRRALYTFVTAGRRRSQEEKDAVDILERQYGRTADLEEFLSTQGLKLASFDAVALGLANSGRIYVAVRDPVQRAPEHLATREILHELIDERRAESADAAAIWATFFLLALLYFLYTRDDRPIEAISAFKDSAVDLEEFLDEVRHRIEEMRLHAEPEDPQQKRVHAVLTSLSDAALEGRAKTFFNSMVRMGVLEPLMGVETRAEVREQVYRQSLWSAVDIAANFQRHAGPLAAAGIVAVADVVTPEVEGVAAEGDV